MRIHDPRTPILDHRLPRLGLQRVLRDLHDVLHLSHLLQVVQQPTQQEQHGDPGPDDRLSPKGNRGGQRALRVQPSRVRGHLVELLRHPVGGGQTPRVQLGPEELRADPAVVGECKAQRLPDLHHALRHRPTRVHAQRQLPERGEGQHLTRARQLPHWGREDQHGNYYYLRVEKVHPGVEE